MSQNTYNEAAIPNPLLIPWSVLVGEWNITWTHRLQPGTTLHGNASFTWLQRGAFLMWQTETEETGFPSAISIFGSDDAAKGVTMLYFDERGVSRKFEASLENNVWKLSRNAPKFSQRFTGTIADDGNTMLGVWELSEDDSTWKQDAELTYQRVSETALEKPTGH